MWHADNVIFCLQIGLVDLEINRLTKILFLATMLLSVLLLAVKVGSQARCSNYKNVHVLTKLLTQGFTGLWFVYLIRYVILFSYIIPIR